MKYKVETKLKEIAKKEAREEYIKMKQLYDNSYERTAEEIRNYLLNEEYYSDAQIEGIPEAVASSTESSYMQALAETFRIGRPRHPHYR
jgi:nitrate reductase beta subunit